MSCKIDNVTIKEDDLKEESVCRLCLSTDANVSMFGEGIKIIHIINECCPISITIDDALPKQICQHCMSTLNICEDFRQKCIQSDQELRSRLLHNEPVIKTEQDYDYEDANIPLIEYNEFKLETITDESYTIDKKHKKKRSKKSVARSKRIKNVSIIISTNGDRGSVVHKVKRKRIKKDKDSPKTKSHLCPICGKIFTGKSSVSAHIKTHSTERPFVCPVCNKTFRTKSHLKLHSSAHSDTRNFICSMCPKTFKAQTDLKRHISIIHHGARKATCEICGREMATRNNLKAHMLIHSGVKNFECSVCSQKFTFKSSLKTHFRIHSGEKPYLCKFCDARFSMQRSLRDHERLHTGETPYQCPCCPKAFNQLSNMKSHFRHNHRDVDFDKVYKGPRKTRYNI